MSHCRIDTVISDVRAFLKSNKPSDLAKSAGIRQSTISEIHKSEWNPRVSTLRKLEFAVTKNNKLTQN